MAKIQPDMKMTMGAVTEMAAFSDMVALQMDK